MNKEPQIIPQAEKLNFTTKLSYGAGDFGTAITANILAFFFLPFLTNVAGLPASLAGSVLMIGKIIDAVNDPFIGVSSDRTRLSWGRRLPWMLFGAIPLGLFFALTWIVPHFSSDPKVQQWALFAYYAIVSSLFSISFTTVNLPYTALTPELTQDYNERTSLNSFRFTFSIGGSILSLLLALAIFSIYKQKSLVEQHLYLGLICSLWAVIPIFWCVLSLQERGSNPILNPAAKKLVGRSIMVAGIISLIYSLWNYWHSGTVSFLSLLNLVISPFLLVAGLTIQNIKPEAHLQIKSANKQHHQAVSFAQQLKIVFANRPFLYVIGIYLTSWLAVQLTASILLYYVVNYMQLKREDSSILALAVQGTALLLLFFWRYMSNLIGKKGVFICGSSIWIVAQIGLFLLKPGQTNLMYLLAILAGVGVSVAYLIPWSMIPDVIELDELNTGERREGIFYGFMVLLQKLGLAIGLFLVGLMLQSAGFVSSSGDTTPAQPASALWAIRLVIGPMPLLCLIIACILAYFYPITKEVHEEIRLQLLERQNHN